MRKVDGNLLCKESFADFLEDLEVCSNMPGRSRVNIPLHLERGLLLLALFRV